MCWSSHLYLHEKRFLLSCKHKCEVQHSNSGRMINDYVQFHCMISFEITAEFIQNRNDIGFILKDSYLIHYVINFPCAGGSHLYLHEKGFLFSCKHKCEVQHSNSRRMIN